jgi:hypothetical protein
MARKKVGISISEEAYHELKRMAKNEFRTVSALIEMMILNAKLNQK